jgi:hypothetical protein
LTGLPVEPVIPGLTYRVRFDAGTADLTLEGENGRLDVNTVSQEVNEAFFASWSGDPIRGREVAASIADWIDTDEDVRLLGAESPFYLGRGYSPRTGGLGVADLPLVKGTAPDDFRPAIIEANDTAAVRSPVHRFLANVRAGNRVNPNYASRLVLESMPGMTVQTVERILETRQQSKFIDAQDFANRTGISPTSPVLNHLTFDRGTAPAILSVARPFNSARMYAERRTVQQSVTTRFTGLIERMPPR